MTERDRGDSDPPAGMILKEAMRARFEAKLVEDSLGTYGISYVFMKDFPNIPTRPDPTRDIDLKAAVLAKYRAAIITQLLEKGVVDYAKCERALRRSHITMPFIPEAYRMAYEEILDCLQGLGQLPEVKLTR